MVTETPGAACCSGPIRGCRDVSMTGQAGWTGGMDRRTDGGTDRQADRRDGQADRRDGQAGWTGGQTSRTDRRTDRRDGQGDPSCLPPSRGREPDCQHHVEDRGDQGPWGRQT